MNAKQTLEMLHDKRSGLVDAMRATDDEYGETRAWQLVRRHRLRARFDYLAWRLRQNELDLETVHRTIHLRSVHPVVYPADTTDKGT